MANEYLNATIEKVRKVLPEAYEAAGKGVLYGLMQKAPAEKITKTTNGLDFRIPMKMQRAGVFGKANLAGGSLMTGSKTNIKQMYQTYFTTQLAFELNMEDVLTTQNQELAIVNAFNDAMKEAPTTYIHYLDIGLHAIGAAQGLVALSTSVTSGGGGTETVTCDSEYAANLVTEGMRLEIYSNDLGTHRTAAVPDDLPYVSTVDKTAGTFVITNLGAIIPQSTDYYALPGVGTVPAWVNGLNYFHTTATTGNLLGLSRVTYKALLPNKVNASSGALVPDHIWQLQQQIRQRNGNAPLPKLTGLLHDAQAYQIGQLGLAISGWQRGASDKMIDVAPAIGDTVPLAGINFMKDVHASKTKVHLLDLSEWGRVELFPKDFFKVPGDGTYIHLKRAATTAAATFAIQFWMIASENYYCAKQSTGGFIHSLAIPSGH
jgi:hypothetical protein